MRQRSCFLCVRIFSGGMAMKSVWRDLFTAFIMGMVVPYFMINGVFLVHPVQEAEVIQIPEETSPVPVSTGVSALRRAPDGSVSEMDMEQYLVGVVLAEMPAYFEEEALKAQAVAARTYTAKAVITGGKHGDGSICSDIACCQAYISEEEYLTRGGTQTNLDKVRASVWSTAGQVLTYDGELIEATYFSCSGGSTENAAEVWGTAFPYLVSVDSPGEENAQYYRDTVTFTPEEFAAALELDPEGPVRDWFEMTVYTEGGSVSSITICGRKFTGIQLRSLLGLRSASFSIDASEDTVLITTRGYGHRVGLSQYGADAMAVQGSSYEEILAHYYPGTKRMRLVSNTDGDVPFRMED